MLTPIAPQPPQRYLEGGNDTVRSACPVRDFATNQDRNEAAALQKDMGQKAEKFVKRGGQLYRKAWLRILKTLRTRPQSTVSRESDFQERSLVAGYPPQVIWLKIPNRSKTVVLNILLEHRAAIEQALTQENLACVELGQRA